MCHSIHVSHFCNFVLFYMKEFPFLGWEEVALFHGLLVATFNAPLLSLGLHKRCSFESVMYEWQCWNIKEQDYDSYWKPKSTNAGMCLGGDITCVTEVVQKFGNANCVCVYVCVYLSFLICFEVLFKKIQLFNTEHILWICYSSYCSM